MQREQQQQPQPYDHVEWLTTHFNMMKLFFGMVKTRHGTFHFRDCSWVEENSGPDTCQCVNFMFQFKSSMLTIDNSKKC